MEVPRKKTRAPKTSNTQMEYLITYMSNHSAFATGKLLGARGKAAHDTQWQQLTEQLNSMVGPSKSVDGWKKLWCDQRNQARARAAKGKAQQRLTGNIGESIQLKDSDLKILSIIGGESSVGLPIMEVSLKERFEDITDPSIILGLVSNNNIGETTVAHHEEQNIIAITETSEENMSFEKDTISFTLSPTFMQRENIQDSQQNAEFNDQPSQSCTSVTVISSQPIDEPSTSSYTPSNTSITPLRTISKRSLMTTSNVSNTTKCGSKRLRSSSLEEATKYFKNAQEKHSEDLQAVVKTLNRIASATEAQNELLRTSLALHERTLNILAKTVMDLTEKM